MKKRIVSITLAVVMTSFLLTGCNKENIANEDNNNTETDSGDGLSTLDSSDTTESEPDADVADSSDTDIETEITTDTDSQTFNYHFADQDEAISCFLSNEDYFNGFSTCDLQYKTGKKDGTIEDYKEFGVSQMLEFTDSEKESIDKLMAEIEEDIASNGYYIPEVDEITFIKSTQDEENGSGAYTHGTQIYFGQSFVDLFTSDNPDYYKYGKSILWHELFHCLTRNNPDFRAYMYSIINFTVQDNEYDIPPSVFDKYISNPDVEHHNAYATFHINGEDIDCYTVLIATKPFEKEGDSFFDCMETALVPVDGSDIYYVPDDADNFWDVFGMNTGYVIDPEECMADNFSYALTYGLEEDYESPEIIEAIIDYLSMQK